MDAKLTTPISPKRELSYEEAATIGVGTEVIIYQTHPPPFSLSSPKFLFFKKKKNQEIHLD